MSLLEAKNVTKRFGGLVAVDNVSCHVNQGEIFGLIGPNGSGKSVFFNLITGMYGDDGGEIIFDGKKINGLPAHTICKMGISRTFQGSRIFRRMSVLENIMSGSYCRTKSNFIDAILRTPRSRQESKNTREKAISILKFVGIENMRGRIAGDLTYVMRSLLGIGIALASDPKLLLLDEPLAGMNPSEIANAMELIRKIRDRGITVFLIEHHVKAVMGCCSRVHVISSGSTIAEGTPEEVSANKKVIEAYLGRGYGVKS